MDTCDKNYSLCSNLSQRSHIERKHIKCTGGARLTVIPLLVAAVPEVTNVVLLNLMLQAPHAALVLSREVRLDVVGHVQLGGDALLCVLAGGRHQLL